MYTCSSREIPSFTQNLMGGIDQGSSSKILAGLVWGHPKGADWH